MNANQMSQYKVGETVFRHGDVLLKRSDKTCKGRYVASALLYKGENHHHRLTGGKFRIVEEGGAKLLEVKAKTKLVHEEHGPLALPPGSYAIDIQLEYDHFAEESRRVID